MTTKNFYPKNISGVSFSEKANTTEVELRKLRAELDYYKELAERNHDLYYRMAEDCVRGRGFGIICNDCTITIEPTPHFPIGWTDQN
jgi:hypothetical protein